MVDEEEEEAVELMAAERMDVGGFSRVLWWWWWWLSGLDAVAVEALLWWEECVPRKSEAWSDDEGDCIIGGA